VVPNCDCEDDFVVAQISSAAGKLKRREVSLWVENVSAVMFCLCIMFDAPGLEDPLAYLR
jgi:hypothetical protein